MTDQAAQSGGYAHNQEIKFEIGKYFFRPVIIVDFVGKYET